MARPLRFQYPGAVYHLMARGDGGDTVLETDDDRKSFLFRLGEVCESHGWRVHAYVLMSNHFHLLLETPQANLVTGMKWLLGTYSQGWNRARKRRGHVFQGRYKSVPVSGSDSDPYYFRIVADYIHLNPARAGLAGGARGPLCGYSWSSLPAYEKGRGPEWLSFDRVLRAFELARDGRGRRAYVAWLEARAANDGGQIDAEATKALKRGWYLGKESFKDRLLKLLEKPPSSARGGGPARGEGPARERGEKEAARLVAEGLRALGLPAGKEGLAKLKKSDPLKVRLAMVLRARTSVSNAWIAERLAMGHPGAVSRVVALGRSDRVVAAEAEELAVMLIRED
jgi:REP element-mobilizing transposase RayT